MEQLKGAALQGIQAEQRAKELAAENKQLQGMIPSAKERLKENEAQLQIKQENRQLRGNNKYLQEQLDEERSFSAQLLERVTSALEFLEKHLPEPLRPLVEKTRQLISVPDLQKSEKSQIDVI